MKVFQQETLSAQNLNTKQELDTQDLDILQGIALLLHEMEKL